MKINRGILLLTAAVAVAGVSGIMAQRNGSKTETVASITTDRVIIEAPEEHWTATHLRALDSESTPEQSIYLSAVQRVKMDRNRGKVVDAVTFLEDLAVRCTDQQLKSAIRRLIVDIQLEVGDNKRAEQQMDQIIEENLLQL